MRGTKVILHIKDAKDVLLVADALLKSGYTVSTPKKKVGAKYEQYVVAYLPGAETEQEEGLKDG